MNPFLLAPRERLADWKAFRAGLPALDEPAQLAAVATYFAQAPLLTRAYDPEDPPSWPTPWEMISDGAWCARSRAIGMEITLRLAGWDPGRLRLTLFNDKDLSDLVFVLIVDGVHFLNYEHGVVCPDPGTHRYAMVSWVHGQRAYVAA